MLGWINISVKLFVIESFGEDKWNLVREKLDGMNDWLSYQQYEDGVTVSAVPILNSHTCLTAHAW